MSNRIASRIFLLLSYMEPEHTTHGILIGLATAVALAYTRRMDLTTAVITGGAVGTAATAYMLKWGHALPE
jgi:hypothetical protein